MNLFKNIFILFFITPLVLFSNELNLTKIEKDFIKEHPIIKFSDVKWQPFFDIKNDEYSGIFKEYYKLIEKRTGLKFEFVKFDDGLNFQTVLNALKSKKIDMIDGTGKTKDRSSYALFSNPLMKVSLAIISNISQKFTSLEQVKNKRIVVAKGSTASEYLREFYPQKKFIYTNGLNEAIDLVESRQADVLIDNIVVLDYLIKKFNYKDVQISGVTDYDFTIYALIRNDYKVLQSILNKAINSISKEELHNINNLLILSSLIPAKEKINFSNEEKKYIEEKNIKVAMLNSFYPFSFLDKDRAKGYSYDFFKLISKKSNLKIDYIFDSWNNNLNKFKSNQVDLIDAISLNKKRKKFINFTDPYFEIPNVIFSRKNEFKKFKGLPSLENRKVGITKGVYYYNDIKNITNINLVEYENLKQSLKALAFGKVDAVFGNFITGQNNIKRGAYSNVEIVDEINENLVKREDLRIGIQKEDAILQSIIDKTIKSISPEEKKKLNDKWFSASYESESKSFISFNYDELKYLSDIKTIRMCVDPKWKPYEEIIDNKHVGLVADFIDLIEEKINKKIQLVYTKNWLESLEYAKNRKCQILSFLNESTLRKEFLNFTPTLYKEFDVIVTRTDVTYIDGLSSLDGKSLALVKGYITPEEERNLNINVDIKHVDSTEEAIKMVSEGKVFGTVGSFLGTVDIMKKLNLPNLKIASKTGIENAYKIGVVKNEKTLLSILSKAVLSISEKEKNKIINEHISIKIDSKFDYDLFFKITFVFLIMMIFLIYRHYEIKRINKKLKDMVEKELKKSRDKDKLLFQQNKMVSMGQMLENIAHQWRQPLSQINSSVLIMDNILNNNKIYKPELYEKLNEIESMTKYMSTTIDDFKQFVSINRNKQKFNVIDVVKKSINIVKASYSHKNIELVLLYDKENLIYKGFPNELQQVLLVVFNNAKDAFSVKNIRKAKVTISIKENNNNYDINISDNAGGIDERIKDKIFEPYFTTKHPSVGTGLGLYISKKILEENMNGNIDAFNSENGATFIITLRNDNV